MKLTKLDKCPQWPLIRIISIDHWTDPVIEYFGESRDGPPTHMHVYKPDVARMGYRDGKFTIPPTITTVSYAD